MRILLIVFSVFCLGLSARAASVDSKIERFPLLSQEAVMRIPEQLAVDLERIKRRTSDPERKLKMLVEYLFLDSGLGMRYEADATLTVAEAYAQRRANCLSFTLLSLAAARAVGLTAYPQDLSDVLIWAQDGSLTYRISHVNTGIAIGEQRFAIDVAFNRLISQRYPRRISDQTLLANFFSNRAVDFLVAGEMEAAQTYQSQAMRLAPKSSRILNNAGVIAQRLGQADLAERHYRAALARNRFEDSALANLALLFERQGRAPKAEPLLKRLSKVRARNPFYQFQQGLKAEAEGNWDLALKYYQRANGLHRDEHRFHFALARAHLMLGHRKQAEHELQLASRLSKGDQQTRYRQKLARLSERRASS
jgi:tetratricopeptide (TPR) repeat protein